MFSVLLDSTNYAHANTYVISSPKDKLNSFQHLPFLWLIINGVLVSEGISAIQWQALRENVNYFKIQMLKKVRITIR